MAEGTKCQKPDELDIILHLAQFDNIFAPEMLEYAPDGFVGLKVNGNEDESKRFRKYIMDGYLDRDTILTDFMQKFEREILSMSTWKGEDIRNIYPTHDLNFGMAHAYSVGDIAAVRFIWHGNYYKQVSVSVDVVPAILIRDWWPFFARIEDPLGNPVRKEMFVILRAKIETYVYDLEEYGELEEEESEINTDETKKDESALEAYVEPGDMKWSDSDCESSEYSWCSEYSENDGEFSDDGSDFDGHLKHSFKQLQNTITEKYKADNLASVEDKSYNLKTNTLTTPGPTHANKEVSYDEPIQRENKVEKGEEPASNADITDTRRAKFTQSAESIENSVSYPDSSAQLYEFPDIDVDHDDNVLKVTTEQQTAGNSCETQKCMPANDDGQRKVGFAGNAEHEAYGACSERDDGDDGMSESDKESDDLDDGSDVSDGDEDRGDIAFRLSYSKAENESLKSFPQNVKRAYILSKILVDFIPAIRAPNSRAEIDVICKGYTPHKDAFSYLIKTTLFHVVRKYKDHPFLSTGKAIQTDKGTENMSNKKQRCNESDVELIYHRTKSTTVSEQVSEDDLKEVAFWVEKIFSELAMYARRGNFRRISTQNIMF